jgi:hypothetical protein
LNRTNQTDRRALGIEQQAYFDIDSLLRPVYGHAKQGASFGHAKIAGRQVLRRGHAGQQPMVPDEVDQMRPRDRRQLQGVAVGSALTTSCRPTLRPSYRSSPTPPPTSSNGSRPTRNRDTPG